MVSSPGEEHEGHRVGHHEDGEEVGGRQLARREGADSAACRELGNVNGFMIPDAEVCINKMVSLLSGQYRQ